MTTRSSAASLPARHASMIACRLLPVCDARNPRHSFIGPIFSKFPASREDGSSSETAANCWQVRGVAWALSPGARLAVLALGPLHLRPVENRPAALQLV